jgi:hypothetical protein
MPDPELCLAPLNTEPPRFCTLPKGHDGPHTMTVSHAWQPDMVNHPPHYMRGPDVLVKEELNRDGTGGKWTRPTMELGRKLYVNIECIEVIRHITDYRLGTAIKYIWRVAFGGKADDTEDIQKAITYLKDWLEHPNLRSRPAPPTE